ncbi:MAG: glycerophosphodiester phosphodiesterase family protein [Pirellulales bacterium]
MIGNIIFGIKQALIAKIDFIEVDLRVFSGNEQDLVLYHDSNLGKLEDTCGLLESEGRRIEELTKNEIRDLSYRTLGADCSKMDSSVVFFSEFLELISDSSQHIILDLKFASLKEGPELTDAFKEILFQLNQHEISADRLLVFSDFKVLTDLNMFLATFTDINLFNVKKFNWVSPF